MKEFAYIHDVEKLPKLLKNVPLLNAFNRRHLEEILFSSCYAEYEPGEMALLGIERRTATVTARTKVVCLAIDQRFLNEIASPDLEAPYYVALYGFLCRVLAERLQRATASLARQKKRRGKKY